MNQLASILKQARAALNLTQEDVAKKLGISQRAYAFYEDETREQMPRAKRIKELGKILNIPVKTLIKHYNSELEEHTSIIVKNEPDQPKDQQTAAFGAGQPDDLPTLLQQLMQKQNQLMEMQNKILADTKEDLIEKVKEIHLNSKSTIAYLQTILRVNRADDSVIMDNQDLQAGREIGSSAIQAGNLELAAAKHLRKKDRKNQGGVGK